MRLCVCLVTLCELFELDGRPLDPVDDLGQTPGDGASVIGLFPQVAHLFCDVDLRDAVQQIAFCDVGIFFP